MHLFGLYVLFSQFRPHVHKGIAFWPFINYVYICTWIRRHSKATVLRVNITGSEMGKQNMQAKRPIYKSLCTLVTTFCIHIKWRVLC